VKKQSHPRFPQTLIRFQGLEGGVYGTLTLVARDRDTLEIQLGNDFVRINAEGASQIAQALELFSGAPVDMVVEVEEEEERDTDVVVEPEPPAEPRLARPKRPSRRRVA